MLSSVMILENNKLIERNNTLNKNSNHLYDSIQLRLLYSFQYLDIEHSFLR